MSPDWRGKPRIALIGAGFSGIGMARQLLRQGFEDITIFERAEAAGGVWQANGYPGAACDVPSRLYCFSFAPNPDWSRRYAPQAEIQAYLQDCIRRFGIGDRIRYGKRLRQAEYDEDRRQWQLHFDDGERVDADVLIIGAGILSEPKVPTIPGLADFAGPVLHTARWRQDFDPIGKRIGVIGTGASAIQAIPELAKSAARLEVFQRSAPHVLSKFDWAYPSWVRRLRGALPFLDRLSYRLLQIGYELRGYAFHAQRWTLKPYDALTALQRWFAIRDATLRRKLTPRDPLGCKRVLISDRYYPAMQRGNVGLHTEAIAAVESTGIRMQDGRLLPLDALVLATGFVTSPFFSQCELIGRDAMPLSQAWRARASAWHGLCVPGFPDAFFLYGPNTNLGHNGIPYMLESQFGFVLQALQHRARSGRAVEVREDAMRRFDAEMQRRLADGVWQHCRNWYVDEQGNDTHNWPGSTWEYRRRTRRLDARDFL